MVDTFSFTPSRSFSRKSKPNVVSAQFGDGYSQRIRRGINTLSDSWEVSFINQPLNIAEQIIVFLTNKAGSEYFLFNPPGDINTYKVICQDWSTEYTSHISRTITTTFIRVYDII